MTFKDTVAMGMALSIWPVFACHAESPKIEVTQMEDGAVKEMRIETPDGRKATMTMKAGGGAENLGVPVYPGAESDMSMDMIESGDKASTVGKATMSSFSTSDGLDKVAAFYREALKSRSPKEMNLGSMVNFIIEGPDGEGTSIILTGAKADTTSIQIMKAKRKGS